MSLEIQGRPCSDVSLSGTILFALTCLIDYGKCPSFKHFILYFFCVNLLFMQLFLKILSGMSNSVDPNHTAPEGAV